MTSPAREALERARKLQNDYVRAALHGAPSNNLQHQALDAWEDFDEHLSTLEAENERLRAAYDEQQKALEPFAEAFDKDQGRGMLAIDHLHRAAALLKGKTDHAN